MGFSHRVYVGPYIRCQVDRTHPTITMWGCTSDVCDLIHKREKLPPHVKFCPNCGSPTGDIEVKGNECDAISCWKLNEATDERWAMFNSEYAKPGVHLFVPNQDWPREFVVDSGSTGEVISADPDIVTKEIEWLATEYAEALGVARELYREDKVEILWGVLAEYC